MNKESEISPVMMEILVVTLFLALSTSVLIQLIAKAHSLSVTATVKSHALILTEQTLEGIKADPFGDGAFDENGVRTFSVTQDGITVTSVIERQESASGAYYALTATADDGSGQLLTLSSGRYLPGGEVSP